MIRQVSFQREMPFLGELALQMEDPQSRSSVLYETRAHLWAPRDDGKLGWKAEVFFHSLSV